MKNVVEKSTLVSVQMLTYKHEAYIRQAIESVLMQKTDFELDLIIADDCSPDKTPEIVNDVIRNNPKGYRIKYFRHEQNIGIQKNGLFALSKCKGKYIAICEGDDYWTDPYKLQKQVDLMEKNPSYNISFHLAKIINEYNSQVTFTEKYNEDETIIPVEIIIKSNGGFMPTSSIMLRKIAIDNFLNFQNQSPGLPIGDYFLMVLGAIPDGAIYFPDTCSVYRKNSISSITNILSKTKGRLNFCKKMLIAYNDLDNFTKKKYSSFLNKRKFHFLKWNINFFMRRLKFYRALVLVLYFLKNQKNPNENSSYCTQISS